MTEELDRHAPSDPGTAHPARNIRITEAGNALEELASVRPELASALAGLTIAIASEAKRNKRFATALSEACMSRADGDYNITRNDRGRGSRRAAGPWDPFAVFAEHGEAALRDRLSELNLDQLRDIIAEHGMDTDRLALKWRNPNRLVDRIIERVVDRAVKGDAFRSPHART